MVKEQLHLFLCCVKADKNVDEVETIVTLHLAVQPSH